MKTVWLIIVASVVVLSGCSTTSFDGTLIIPPPEPINATLYGANPAVDYSTLEFQGEGYNQVLARVDSVLEYATTHRWDSDTHYRRHWYLVSCTVLKVEKGEWMQRTLVFPATEGSGGLVEFLPVEFIKGRFFLFGMRQTRGLPEITFYQRRSHFLSHWPIEEPHWYYPLDDAERIRRINAIRQAAHITDVRQPFSADRQIGHFVVIEDWLSHEYGQSWMLVLDSRTLELVPFRTNELGEIVILDGEIEQSH